MLVTCAAVTLFLMGKGDVIYLTCKSLPINFILNPSFRAIANKLSILSLEKERSFLGIFQRYLSRKF